jgi:small conductance mechanosensitive channel
LIEFTGTLNIRWTIEEVNTKHTVVRMFDKRRVIIPNSIVASTPVKTIKLEELIRWEFMIKIPRNIEVSAIRQMLIKIINETDWVIHQEYSNIIVSWFDTSWIIIKWFFFVNPQTKRNVFAVNMDLKNKILETFKKYWIKIPYNHLTINIEK